MRSVCVFTSTRADYGLLSPLIKKIGESKNLQLRVFVTGTHLQKSFGYTLNEILQDGVRPYYQVEIGMEPSTQGIGHLPIIAESLVSFAIALKNDKPDLAVVLGDRYEAMAFAMACSNLGIPLAHLHGGEVTLGALDEIYRHCITKMSQLHFAAAEIYRNRIIRMGENPQTVFNVGALAADNVHGVSFMAKAELESSLGLAIKEKLIMLTYHPETANSDADQRILPNILKKLESLLAQKDTTVLVTGTNADVGSAWIRTTLQDFVKDHFNDVHFIESLGKVRYLSALNLAYVVLGNSSSGVIEAPILGVPTINVGNRQAGRERLPTVIDADGSMKSLDLAFAALEEKRKGSGKGRQTIFGDGTTAKKIVEIIEKVSLTDLLHKRFYDASEK